MFKNLLKIIEKIYLMIKNQLNNLMNIIQFFVIFFFFLDFMVRILL